MPFLPPYPPDLNPIERMFAAPEALLGKAAARSVDAAWRRIGKLLDDVSPTECRNCLPNAGDA